ncbi:hypothetical protein MTF66_02225 [Pseudoalteromonas sp. 2CM39R]|uniref:hypothetical protein n=1 Tax=Pseudoalteromonas sp. 2CM39R TaxID=2929856 RepID=UPI0020C13370|nr:hypothetical protein [Pseudoalteromonas sp. 2CM39R]MCK8123798.1 hypothetical protein [Pseudoalteromonas sp. 2CM39R]
MKKFSLITIFISLTGNATELQTKQLVDEFIQNQYKDHFPELVSDDESDPRCCPSKKTTLRYRIYKSDLVKL